MSDEKPSDPTPADVAREEPPVVVEHEPQTADPLVEPVETRTPSLVEPVETTPQSLVEPVETTPRETAHVDHVEPTPTVAPPAPVGPPTQAASNVIYVDAPVAPRKRGNRVVGTLLAVLGAVLFAVVYASVYAFATTVAGLPVASAFTGFISSYLFWVPVLIFLVAFVLLVLVLNRAGWWAHVLGSLIVALVVYVGSAAVLQLVSSLPLFAPEAENRPITYFLALPGVIIAGIVAREVSIWIGLAIAARGRRLTVRNREARADFDREQAEKRAEYERSTSPA